MFKKALVPMIAAAALFGSPLVASAQSSMGSSMSMGAMMHGMPAGKAGGDGVTYTGAPDLQAAVSLVVAGGPIGSFSLVKSRNGNGRRKNRQRGSRQN